MSNGCEGRLLIDTYRHLETTIYQVLVGNVEMQVMRLKLCVLLIFYIGG